VRRLFLMSIMLGVIAVIIPPRFMEGCLVEDASKVGAAYMEEEAPASEVSSDLNDSGERPLLSQAGSARSRCRQFAQECLNTCYATPTICERNCERRESDCLFREARSASDCGSAEALCNQTISSERERKVTCEPKKQDCVQKLRGW